MTAALPIEQPEVQHVGPNSTQQEKAFASSADIVIYGGEAGGGKTYWLLMDPMRYLEDYPEFGAVIFRRTKQMIRQEGGLWDTSMTLYGPHHPHSVEGPLIHTFPSGARISFEGCEHEHDVENFKGAQIAYIGIDQLEEWTERMFFYILSRNRSTCGVPPCLRATCNPDADSFLAVLLEWWIDQETGYPIPEHDGVIRWMLRYNEKLYWDATREELWEKVHAEFPTLHQDDFQPNSITFIAGSIYDNVDLMEKDPAYVGKLMALPLVDRERLLGQRGRRGGNWKIKAEGGKIFNAQDFKVLPASKCELHEVTAWVRYWDKAGTEYALLNPDRAFTSGVLMGVKRDDKGKLRQIVVADVVRGQWKSHKREEVIKNTAKLDKQAGIKVSIWVEQEPGSGGKESAENTILNLAGFDVHAEPATGSKFDRADPYAAQVQGHNVVLVEAAWNKAYISEHHSFSPHSTVPKDQVDASSGAFNKLIKTAIWRVHRVNL